MIKINGKGIIDDNLDCVEKEQSWSLIILPVATTIIALIISIVFNFISLQTEENIHAQALEFELDTENNSDIYERYILMMTEYLELRKSQDSNSKDKSDFSSIEKQIDDINTKISVMSEKIENLIDAADKSNDNVIISSAITGICTIIAALIAGAVAIKVANEKKGKKRKRNSTKK